jgi:ethanolamine utilization protein EutN
MILGKVTGNIISTIHHSSMDSRKLLIVDKLDADSKPTGNYLIAVDAIGAGNGETVIVLDEGGGANMVLQDNGLPVRSVVVGVVG